MKTRSNPTKQYLRQIIREKTNPGFLRDLRVRLERALFAEGYKNIKQWSLKTPYSEEYWSMVLNGRRIGVDPLVYLRASYPKEFAVPLGFLDVLKNDSSISGQNSQV